VDAETDLSEDNFPIAYKYGVFEVKERKLFNTKNGNNRLTQQRCVEEKNYPLIHDGFIHSPITHGKVAGVAIPGF
jgi:4-alpha-glucanotransferase